MWWRKLASTLGGVAACSQVNPSGGIENRPKCQIAFGSNLATVAQATRKAAVAGDRGCEANGGFIGKVSPSSARWKTAVENRAVLLAHTKAAPVWFPIRPRRTVGYAAAVHWQQTILDAEQPASAFLRNFGKLVRDPALLRAVLLREGYLYIDDPSLAEVVVTHVRVDHLFSEGSVMLQRGSEQFRLEKKGRFFEYADGPDAGRRASLLLFDRLWRGAAPEPIHRDVSQLADRLGFDEMEILDSQDSEWSVRLRFGDQWVHAILERDQYERSVMRLRCMQSPSHLQNLQMAQANKVRRKRVLRQMASVIQQQINENLPFDEPRTEEGQQDGKLRLEWRIAYNQGRLRFDFNGDDYRVFDAQGRPFVPQVCIDFVTDTFERLSGTWYRSRGEVRGRVQGRLDFSKHAIENRRSVESFLEFAGRHPAWFDVYWLQDDERTAFRDTKNFFASIYKHRERYLPGDVIAIHGLRDDGKLHYHSFIVLERDPISGMPTLVAANAGRPRIRSWAQEMRSAPHRSIRARLRPRIEWLESLVEPVQVRADAEPAETSRLGQSET